jgi:AraC-like DNA-binding protein
VTDSARHPQPIPFITLPNWVKAAARCGFNIEPVFRELGIETDLIHLETATVPVTVLEQAMEACIARTRRGHFPFVLGETFSFDYLPDLETFVTTSPTLREAARVFDWVRALINPMINVQLAEAGGAAALVLTIEGADFRSPGYKPHFVEATFAAVVKFGRQLLRGRADFSRLVLAHAAPPYAAAYKKYFRLPVAFGAQRNALEIDRGVLDLKLPGSYPALHRQAEMRVEQRAASAPATSNLVATIEAAFARQPQLLGGGIGKVAAQLGLHARALQRRLQEEGHRFADIQARARYRLAVQFLEQPGADVEDVSEKLGFSDRRSFTRAFTRWSGVTPSVFRTRVGAASAAMAKNRG